MTILEILTWSFEAEKISLRTLENNDQSCLDDEVRKSEKNQIFDELISEATRGKHTYSIQQNHRKMRKFKELNAKK